jgi:hypothetical protein
MCYGEIGVLSLINHENPQGIFIFSNLDYFNYYFHIDTPRRRPSPLEYYEALSYFRKYGAATEDIINCVYSSDEDEDFEYL